nr:hypothetical protein [uncultured Flavobacterium sp.]
MKKIFTVIALSLLLFACTNESEVATKEATVNKSMFAKEGEIDLDQLYDDMIKSEAYVVYESLQKDFIAKINFTGDVSKIDTNEKLLNWISDNLSQTSFKNIEEAEDQSENLKLAFDKVYFANEKLFIGSATSVDPKKDLTRFVPIRFPYNPTTLGDDPCGCKLDFNNGMTQSQNQFSLAVGNAVAGVLTGTITGAKASEIIDAQRNVFVISAGIYADLYIDCALGCKK